MHYNKHVCISVIYTISITLVCIIDIKKVSLYRWFVFINYVRILLYSILIDSLSQRTFIIDFCLVFKYILDHFDWPLLSRINHRYKDLYIDGINPL